MNAYDRQKMDALTATAQALALQVRELAMRLQETRDILESLGALQGLEWLPDLKQWVSTEKLAQLRREPR